MRVLVTGASGFIGRHLVRALGDEGHVVLTMARRDVRLLGATEHCVGDVSLADTWRRAGKFDAVAHLAGLSDASLSHDRPVEYNTSNAVGTLLGLEAAREQGALFVLASSQRVYRSADHPLSEEDVLEPSDPYGYSKLVAESWTAMYRRVFQVQAVVLRFFSVYGPGQFAGRGASGVVALFTTRALRGEELVVHNQSWRDFTYVGDVVAGIRLALAKPQAIGEVFNIATGIATSTEALAHSVRAVTGAAVTVRAENRVRGESLVANIEKARARLGYCPTLALRQGLERYVEWLRANG